MAKSGPILIFGNAGQVARALKSVLGDHAIALPRAEADLSKPESLLTVLNQIQPSAVMNAAAYTQVDLAEKEEALARIVNAESPGIIAQWCAQQDIPLIHFSTDYVFSGEGDRPWTEQDPIAPVNAYGRTKGDGEKQVIQAGGKHLIFRTSWVYDATGKNFLTTILRLSREKESLRIVNDQTGAPTYAKHLAEAVARALNTALTLPHFPSGVFHLCNAGETTWCRFAEAIVEQAKTRGLACQVHSIEGIPTSEYPTPAKRPRNSRLDNTHINQILHVVMPDWKVGLAECMDTFKPTLARGSQ